VRITADKDKRKEMKILILSDINSAHTQKWVKGLCGRGISICLFSFSYPTSDWFKSLENFEIGHSGQKQKNSNSLLTKLGYFRTYFKLKKCIARFNPDVIHAHYASSYGLLGKLSRQKPFVISVWGADVYDFPSQSVIKKKLLESVLNSANVICSTSNSMAIETSKYTSKRIQTIPFGIKTEDFQCANRKPLDTSSLIVIGCIKSLTRKYGTNYLIQAFQEVKKEREDLKLKLLLVGGGSSIGEYKALVESLGLHDFVEFTGNVELREVPKYHCKIDIFASLSILDSESFGVSLVEAMASGSHVIATKVSGFKEVLQNCDDYGLMIDRESVDAAKNAMLSIINNPDQARERSVAAIKVVQDNYEWDNNLNQMCAVYSDMLNQNR
jgi:glycosyltransferase involved in cell wall biosynthesis